MQTGIDRSLAGVAVAVLALTAIIGGLALTAPTAETDVVARPRARPRDPVAGVEVVHDAGVTGENVSVGVVDVTGFDPDHLALGARSWPRAHSRPRRPSATGPARPRDRGGVARDDGRPRR